MADPRVAALRSVEFAVPDVKATAAFYEDSWGLAPIAERDGVTYLRGTGGAHHVVALRQGPAPELLRVNLAAPDKATVDALHAKALGFGASVVEAPAPLRGPGRGYGFSFEGIDGHMLSIQSDLDEHGDAGDAPDRPRKLSHVVFNSEQVDTATEYLIDLLGFKLSDRTAMMNFIRCNTDHHSIAFARTGRASLNHIAYEVPSHDALMRGAGRMKEAGFPVEWGVGRHGPGNNIFAYFIEPNGFVVEYTAEVEQVDDAYKVGTPESWKRPANRMDQWGFADPPSARLQAAMSGILPPAEVSPGARR